MTLQKLRMSSITDGLNVQSKSRVSQPAAEFDFLLYSFTSVRYHLESCVPMDQFNKRFGEIDGKTQSYVHRFRIQILLR